jgi:hypothetical protein
MVSGAWATCPGLFARESREQAVASSFWGREVLPGRITRTIAEAKGTGRWQAYSNCSSCARRH